jgi:hypothetical protein
LGFIQRHPIIKREGRQKSAYYLTVKVGGEKKKPSNTFWCRAMMTQSGVMTISRLPLRSSCAYSFKRACLPPAVTLFSTASITSSSSSSLAAAARRFFSSTPPDARIHQPLHRRNQLHFEPKHQQRRQYSDTMAQNLPTGPATDKGIELFTWSKLSSSSVSSYSLLLTPVPSM